ncbi:aryl-sulfate sulfotransferase [Halegenticoccus tardaugens]|uniref:aryl-sulfate sulfotransferase n=1 Tax=Halegenticoccus tardaugens TaxID=2071624 RepID=UPI00100A3B63|nr:aryl-sulfate sulfotransferase [Halegenticoccus tardaugens]
MDERRILRVAFAALLVLAVGSLVAGYLAAPPSFPERVAAGGSVAPPADGATVVATQGFGAKGWHLRFTGDSPGELVAVDERGDVLYYDDEYDSYWDVDPSPEGDRTVMYVASEHLSTDECGAETECYRNVVERTNLSTGETTEVYSRIVPNGKTIRWHDVDRYDGKRLVVADIHRDRVFVVNTETEVIEWEWDAQSDYPTSGGGPYPHDWTHLNDVEVLPDGRIMVSLRNQDQVVFLDPETGLEEGWTLGSEDDYDTLYEQHNPDYIPPENGGPAVLVADSHNNRVVEYGREDGAWNRTWSWNDSRLEWPRDADRLPNGHTLVTDSNGGRVVEVNEEGEVVWTLDLTLPYEAERLGTGPESAGGPSADRADLPSTRANRGGDDLSLGSIVYAVVPGEIVLAVGFVLPAWMGMADALTLAFALGVAALWLGLELYWSPWRVGLRRPVSIRRDPRATGRSDDGDAEGESSEGD